MAYYVYENLVRNKAIVHRGDCGSCNEGTGINGRPQNDRHIWHGPIPTRAAALQLAESTGRKDVRECQHCLVDSK